MFGSNHSLVLWGRYHVDVSSFVPKLDNIFIAISLVIGDSSRISIKTASHVGFLYTSQVGSFVFIDYRDKVQLSCYTIAKLATRKPKVHKFTICDTSLNELHP
jgi:hypothetical protein